MLGWSIFLKNFKINPSEVYKNTIISDRSESDSQFLNVGKETLFKEQLEK